MTRRHVDKESNRLSLWGGHLERQRQRGAQVAGQERLGNAAVGVDHQIRRIMGQADQRRREFECRLRGGAGAGNPGGKPKIEHRAGFQPQRAVAVDHQPVAGDQIVEQPGTLSCGDAYVGGSQPGIGHHRVAAAIAAAANHHRGGAAQPQFRIGIGIEQKIAGLDRLIAAVEAGGAIERDAVGQAAGEAGSGPGADATARQQQPRQPQSGSAAGGRQAQIAKAHDTATRGQIDRRSLHGDGTA